MPYLSHNRALRTLLATWRTGRWVMRIIGPVILIIVSILIIMMTVGEAAMPK